MTKVNDDQSRWRVRMLVLHAAMLAAPIVLLLAHSRFLVGQLGFCVFKYVFGVECPGCGITRSAMSLFTGDITQAFRLHPAGPFVLILIALVTTYLVVVLFTEFRGLQWRREVQLYTGVEVLAFIALLIGWMGKVFVR